MYPEFDPTLALTGYLSNATQSNTPAYTNALLDAGNVTPCALIGTRHP